MDCNSKSIMSDLFRLPLQQDSSWISFCTPHKICSQTGNGAWSQISQSLFLTTCSCALTCQVLHSASSFWTSSRSVSLAGFAFLNVWGSNRMRKSAFRSKIHPQFSSATPRKCSSAFTLNYPSYPTALSGFTSFYEKTFALVYPFALPVNAII